MKKSFFLVLLLSLNALAAHAQLIDKRWHAYVYEMPEKWYATAEAQAIAENVLLYQYEIGGFPKNTPMHKPLTEEEKREISDTRATNEGATTDNDATIMEMDYLSKVYRYHPDERYRQAFIRGLDYLFAAQYPNGGFPQFYPLRKGYYSHITYNDDSMIRILSLLRDITQENHHYNIVIDETITQKARQAFDKGIDCILKTQYRQNGILTGWCAQHDEHTLQPAKARAYELPSLSGQEGANIVLLLMEIEHPSPAVIEAVRAAVRWFDQTRIKGIRVEPYTDSTGKKDRRVIADPAAPDIWARFYTLDTNTPFFCDRDGIPRSTLAEIGQERRGGYGWYTLVPNQIFEKYPAWEEKLIIEN